MSAPFAGLVFLHRLVRISTSTQRHLSSRDITLLLKHHGCRRQIRTFSTASVRFNENEGDGSSPRGPELTPRQALLSRRRRPLSPLERISSLLPQDALSPEVLQLREQQEPEEDTQEDHQAVPEEEEDPETSDPAVETNPPPSTLPGERLLGFGEFLVAEHRKKRDRFKKMFKLQAGTRLQSCWGAILHDDIAGQPAGSYLKTTGGVSIFIRRPSLEDYVLHMKRAPTISYPKDIATMLMMMDVTEGDHVLESGSGTGAMSLFLSRAVGSKGTVLSLEVREDHHKRAVQNYKRWRTSWSVRRGDEWPDNVRFHCADICTASSLLAGQGFHAIALDMLNPHLALPTVLPHLHAGAVCAVYLANITQVIDLLEGIRCTALPLRCERIIEVPIRDWKVAPALQKDGRYISKKAPVLDEEEREEEEEKEEEKTSDEADTEETSTEEQPAFASIPYIARPDPEQMSHTAFLVKLRKFVR